MGEYLPVRVCVVGAGFSGLAAAERLVSSDVNVVVIEARDRVGGRVWSQTLPNGSVIERGAEFVLGDYKEMRATIARLGLDLAPTGMSYGNREPRGADTTTSEVAAGFRTLADVARQRPELPSVKDVIGAVDLAEPVERSVIARLSISAAYEAAGLSASTLLHTGSTASEQESHRVAGGNDGLARSIATLLGERIVLGCQVHSISWADNTATVTGDGFQGDFDAVLVTVPASVMPSIAFDPPLPDHVAHNFEKVVYGHAAKLFVPLVHETEPSSVMSVADHYWCWTARGASGEVQPVVGCFAGSSSALDGLSVTAGPERWLGHLRQLRPDLELDASGAVLSTWDDDPWVGAAYSAEPAGRPRTDALNAPVGPILFAGEHTASEWAGTMEGALRSGHRAAAQLLHRT